MNEELHLPTFPVIIPTIRAVDSLLTNWASFKIEMNILPKLLFFNNILVFLRYWVGKMFHPFGVIRFLIYSWIYIIRFPLFCVFHLYIVNIRQYTLLNFYQDLLLFYYFTYSSFTRNVCPEILVGCEVGAIVLLWLEHDDVKLRSVKEYKRNDSRKRYTYA